MSQIPIILITGFLGAGKTTFLNWLIQENKDLNISVILNEFGDTKLESEFLEAGKNKVVELSTGCMCCIAKSDIPRTVEFILNNSPQTQYILVESSGLSDPDPIRSAFSHPKIKQSVKLESTICIVDCQNYLQDVDQHPILMSQLADADIILLSKTKEAGRENTKVIRATIQAMADDLQILEIDERLSSSFFFDKISQSKPSDAKSNTEHHEHVHQQYQEFIFERRGEMDLHKFKRLISQLPKTIIRAKGYIYYPDLTQQPQKLMIQYVGNHPRYETRTPDSTDLESKTNLILFIGTEFDQEQLEKGLVECFLPL